jgi:hypothetical protein
MALESRCDDDALGTLNKLLDELNMTGDNRDRLHLAVGLFRELVGTPSPIARPQFSWHFRLSLISRHHTEMVESILIDLTRKRF